MYERETRNSIVKDLVEEGKRHFWSLKNLDGYQLSICVSA